MSTRYNNSSIAFAYGRFLKISSTKVERILNYIRYRTYKEVLIFLEFAPYKACFYIWQILINAVANLKSFNLITEKNIFLQYARVQKGPAKKQIRYIARGRYAIIKKKSCHICLGVHYL